MPVAGLLSGRFGSVGRRWRGGSHAVLPADPLPPHVAIAAVALSIAATAVPLALILEPELRGQVAPPRFANMLLGLLLSVPAGVGLAAAFSGLRRLSRFDNGAGWIYEAAVLRILVAAMLFSHAALIGVLSGPSCAGSRIGSDSRAWQKPLCCGACRDFARNTVRESAGDTRRSPRGAVSRPPATARQYSRSGGDRSWNLRAANRAVRHS